MKRKGPTGPNNRIMVKSIPAEPHSGKLAATKKDVWILQILSMSMYDVNKCLQMAQYDSILKNKYIQVYVKKSIPMNVSKLLMVTVSERKISFILLFFPICFMNLYQSHNLQK